MNFDGFEAEGSLEFLARDEDWPYFQLVGDVRFYLNFSVEKRGRDQGPVVS